jgi:CheY-like chemotaxis protein
MPQLDGFGLIRELRADPRLRNPGDPASRAGGEARLEGLGQGADSTWSSPSARELLVASARR